MTVKEAILADIQIQADDNLIEKCLMDVQEDETVFPGDPYGADVKAITLLASIECLQSLINLPDVTEGGYSVRYDKTSMKVRLAYLQTKAGVCLSGDATIKDVSYLW